MMMVYIILGIIIVGSFVSGVVLIVKDNKSSNVEDDNKQLYDDPKELFDNLEDDSSLVDSDTNSVTDNNFDDEII